jgi:uncharacterized membrane protein YfcA
LSLFLFFAAFVGGALNAVAGGGSFIALPALLYAGVPPVAANATTTFALWPGSLSSAVAYRREIKSLERWLATLGGVSVAGGLLGGMLLVRTSDAGFMRLLPWLMLLAALTFTVGGRLAARFRDQTRRAAGPGLSLWALLLQLLIAAYGGYFGGGIGIMMLATLALMGMTDIHRMNGVKAVLAVAINGVALAEFILYGAIAWRPGLVMVAGGILGGYSAAALARRLDQRAVRGLVVVVAWAMTAYFFIRPAS